MADQIDFTHIHAAGGYGSDFESDEEAEKKKEDLKDLLPKKKTKSKVEHKRKLEEEYSKEEGRIHRHHFLSLDAYARHKTLVNNYLLYYGGSKSEFKRDSSRDKTDYDVIRENHRFLWSEEDDAEETWEKRLAKKYYDKLFKEYCIADLSRYKENKVGMRWRTEQEVVAGKGQFTCGNKKCSEKEGLRSWEVNFGYMEHGEKKNALVKLRLCPDCSYKLNYHHKRKEVVAQKKKKKSDVKEHKKRKTDSTATESSEAGAGEQSSSGETTGAGEKGEDASVWAGPAKVVEEKSREEEFDDYFEGMFL